MYALSSAVQKFFERACDYVGKRMPSQRASYTPPRVMNNIEWFKNLGVLEFMRVAGTAARVNSMIARERPVISIGYSSLRADLDVAFSLD